MKRLLLTGFLFISLSSSGQSDTSLITKPATGQDSSEYIKKGIEFIRQVEGQSLTSKNFILDDKPFAFEYYDCLNELLTDSTTFTKDELNYIKNNKFISITKWTKNIFPNIQIISSDTINAIFKDNKKWWAYFYKNYGNSFSSFSFPIFLRDNMYCLFYSDHHCGGLCGGGRLKLYKKEKDGWIEIKSYCNWIS